MSDNRGGIFVDFGDGRGPIHEDDMDTETHIAAFGVPRATEPEIVVVPPLASEPAVAEVPPIIEES